MTDNEIIKALEICAGLIPNACCSDCPQRYLGLSTMGCQIELLKNALDLINRLQAENERLQFELTKSKYAKFLGDYEHIKAEAYKECIEKVKECIDLYEHLACEECGCVPITENELDNILKELVGEDK